MLLLHGRGATAEGILELAAEFPHPDYAFVAPQAADCSWYPLRFLAPVERNEPHLSSALRRIGTELLRLQEAGIPAERTILLGFSQGACLVLEYAARNRRRYAGVAGLSGALIGDPEVARADDREAADLAGTPILLGCSDHDPHIPQRRVEESAGILRSLGAEVTLEIYPGLGHTVNEAELDWVRSRLA
jgi:predicted esterase